MAGFTVAMGVGWVVSPVIRLIINRTQTYISNNYFKGTELESEMMEIVMTLREIGAIMATVENQRIDDPNQVGRVRNHVELVHQIKEAVYDAEDVIDEFEYSILRDQSEKLQKNKVSRIASSSTRTIHRFVVGNAKFKKKVKKIGESLDRAKESAVILNGLMPINNYQDSTTQTNESPYVTSSHLTQPDLIVGRVDEFTLLKDKLREANVSPLPTIIPIIGPGGIGKTTLVQMILNDEEVLNQKKNDKEVKPLFDETVWVTVSDNFNKVRLTKEILKHLSVKFKTEEVAFNKLQEELVRKLASKNILLVLDDVWHNGTQYSNKEDWLEVLHPFQKAEKKSKIILTTRMPDVESILGAGATTIDPINLDKLSDDDSWSLFRICTFSGMHNQKRQVLEPIGKEIVDKLRGLPLAIRVLGNQLNRNPDVEHWTIVNNNPLDTRDVMNILHRSYDHLPDYLKRCFAYCSIFPKDFRFKRDRLVHMWIAQGFVHSEDRNKLENVGIGYFKELLDRSFFQVIKQWDKQYYVMHDLMNDLACNVSKGECLMHNKGEAITNLGSVRHLSLDTISLFRTDVSCLRELRTLIVLDPYFSETEEKVLSYKFHRLRKIRVLDLQFISNQDLTDICESKHLRYLSFRITKNTKIPDRLANLCHLSALFLRKGYGKPFLRNIDPNLDLPESTCSMSNLMLFHSSRSYMAPQVKVGRCMELWRHELSFDVRKNCGHQLDLLGKVNSDIVSITIRGLENVTSWTETGKAQIGKRKQLTYLTLDWGRPVLGMDASEYHKIIESLRPNSNLRELEIRGYPGTAWPSWLESNLLSEIETIRLINSKEIKMLPVLGNLRSIRTLKLVGLAAMSKLDLKCYNNGALPFLENLEIGDMESLEAILNCPGVDQLEIFCPKFKKLELDGFASTKHITIMGSSSTNLEIDGSILRLAILFCPHLASLPALETFASLELLAIFYCPTLNSLSKKNLPASLKFLVIGGRTHQCLEGQIRNKKGPDWDKITAIPGCSLYAAIGAWDSELNHIIAHRHYLSPKELAWELEPYKVNKDVDAEDSTERESTIPNSVGASQCSKYEASSSSAVSPPLPPLPNMLDSEIAQHDEHNPNSRS